MVVRSPRRPAAASRRAGSRSTPIRSPATPRPPCSIPAGALDAYFCTEAKRRAIAHAAELKAKGVIVFVIGLGNVDRTFLGQMASSAQTIYYAPDSSQLQSLFQQVAQQIQLRLVQ
jgi:hypothetical protein